MCRTQQEPNLASEGTHPLQMSLSHAVNFLMMAEINQP